MLVNVAVVEDSQDGELNEIREMCLANVWPRRARFCSGLMRQIFEGQPLWEL